MVVVSFLPLVFISMTLSTHGGLCDPTPTNAPSNWKPIMMTPLWMNHTNAPSNWKPIMTTQLWMNHTNAPSNWKPIMMTQLWMNHEEWLTMVTIFYKSLFKSPHTTHLTNYLANLAWGLHAPKEARTTTTTTKKSVVFKAMHYTQQMVKRVIKIVPLRWAFMVLWFTLWVLYIYIYILYTLPFSHLVCSAWPFFFFLIAC